MTPQEWLGQINNPTNTKYSTRDMAARAEKIIADLLAENASLKAFATELLADFPIYHSVDAVVAQDLAVKHGLMKAETVFVPCSGGDPDFYCACAEAGLFRGTLADGAVCYKPTGILAEVCNG